MALTAVSYGMGVNSKAMIIELIETGFQFDVIQSADTRGEKPKTYLDFFEFDAWLYERGIRAPEPLLWTRPPGEHYAALKELPDKCEIRAVQLCINRSPRAHYISLEDNCLRTQFLPSRAYGFSSCAQKWKHEPMHYFLRHWQPALDTWKSGQKIKKLLGIDAGEAHRAAITEDEEYTYDYPLVTWHWDRDKCIGRIVKAGLTIPVKSACYFCPSSKKKEVFALAKEYPGLFAAAINIERTAMESGKSYSVKGLGRGFSWEELVKSGDASKFQEAEATPCMCFDGEDDD